jgi:glutamine synthetase
MGQTQILPACLRYQGEVATAVNATKSAGVDNTAQASLLKTLTNGIGDLQKALADLDGALGHHADGELIDHARHSRDKVIPAMNAVRAAADRLEGVVADDLWPIPTYREMLFIR